MDKLPILEQKRRIEEILKDYISSPELNVGRLADLLNLSDQYAYQLVLYLYGENPHKIIESYRLIRAIQMIEEDPEANLFRISSLSGYANYNTFRRSFKRRLDISPSGYSQLPDHNRRQVKQSLTECLASSNHTTKRNLDS